LRIYSYINVIRLFLLHYVYIYCLKKIIMMGSNNSKRNSLIRLMLILAFFGFNSLTGWGNVRIPRIISSNMVLQRNAPIILWGWADAREKVTIAFAGSTISSRADNQGKWKIVFPSMPAGGPFSMEFRGKNTILLTNIMVGEVWICSGQSNMEFVVSRSVNGPEEVKNAAFPEIRLFDVPNRVSFKPAEDVSGGEWKECSPATVANFSAVGYFFGRDLYQDLKIPIGLISTNWGGTLIESWTSEDALYTIPERKESVDRLRNLDLAKIEIEQKQKIQYVKSLVSGTTDGLINGTAVWAKTDYDDSGWARLKVPGLWEQSLLPGLDGVVWFRREMEIPEDMTHSDAILSLGKIDDSDITWINGKEVGQMINKYSAERNYAVPVGILKPGKNIITVRIEDTGGGGGFWSEDSMLYLKTTAHRIALAGEWKFKINPLQYSFEESIAGPNDYPSVLYNGMIHPLLNYAVKGAIWYQGEANAEEAYLYRKLLPLMINNWREKWNNPGLAFLIVQLANFMQPQAVPGNSDWAELREAQQMALSVPLTGIAVTIDIGEAEDIHPRNKQDVGYRLSLAARKIAYNETIVYSGPVYKNSKIEGNKMVIEFENIGSGLLARDKYGYLKGFTIAGPDQHFIWARASVEGDRVVVYSPEIEKPAAVRYAWADNPDDANLYNKEGLPASPFRTDSWKGKTVKSK
jgi:sialate O-acetylesterase